MPLMLEASKGKLDKLGEIFQVKAISRIYLKEKSSREKDKQLSCKKFVRPFLIFPSYCQKNPKARRQFLEVLLSYRWLSS